MPTSATDFYNPFVSAAIYNPTTDTLLPLWTDVTREALEAAHVPPGLQALCFVTGVEVTLGLGPVPELSVTLSPPREEAKMLLDSALIEYGVAQLQVQFGYASGTAGGGALMSPLYEGILLEPEVSFGADVSITLRAQGVGGFSAVRQQSGLSWKDKTRMEILQSLAKGPDPARPRNLQIDDSLVLQRRDTLEKLRAGGVALGALGYASLEQYYAQEIATSEYKLLHEDKRTYAQGSKTDWWCINQIARECRCTMYLKGNKVVLVPINASLTDPVKRSLVWFDFPNGEIDPAKGILPIRSFSTNTKAIFLPGALRGLAMADVDSETGDPVKLIVTDGFAKPSRTNDGTPAPVVSENYPDVDEDTGAGAEQQAGSPTDPVSVQQAIAAYDAFTLNMGIQMTVETEMDPLLLPGDNLQVVGVGKRLEGTYAVMNVAYKLGESFDMTLELVSNVGQLVTKMRSEGYEYPEPAGEVGTQKTEQTGDAGGVPTGAPSDPT